MNNVLKIAAIAGVASAMAFAAPSAEARSGRGAAIGLGVAAGALALGAAAAASQPRYYDGGYGYYGRPAYYGDSYNYYGGAVDVAPYAGPPSYYDNYRTNRRGGNSPHRYEGG